MTQREPGYYWIVWDAQMCKTATPALYTSRGAWYICGCEQAFPDTDVIVLGEKFTQPKLGEQKK